jgi:hypothetical protein
MRLRNAFVPSQDVLPFIVKARALSDYLLQLKALFTSVKLKFPLCLTNETLSHEDVGGSGCIDPHFLDLGTSCRWVVNLMPRPLYPRGKSPRYSLDRRLGPRAGLDMEKRKFLTLPGLELRHLGRPACSQSLYRLRYPGSLFTLVLDGSYRSAYCSGRFIPRRSPLCPLDRNLSGSQSRSGCSGEETCLMSLPGIESRVVSSPACSLVASLLSF